nr:sigma-54-dependent Fis family transcriptional regulator [Thermicanus aegyptius]
MIPWGARSGGDQVKSAISEVMMRAILNTIDEGIHVVNAKGVTIFYNRVAASHDNLSVEEVIGRPILEVFPSLSKETSTLLQVVKTGIPILNQQQSYTNLKGVRITTVNTTLPLWVDGKLMGAVEIAKDITKIKELSEKWIDLQVKLQTKQPLKKRGKLPSQAPFTLQDLITQNPEMIRLKERAAKAAETSSPILISGETGTGKELVVQGIHNASKRRDGPFIAQNCAALPGTLLEGILFGTVKGSFTGAENRPGLFELADGGTLFLDELNSMPMDLQAKFLRVLQEGMVRRIGGTQVTPVDVRVIAAMNRAPQEALSAGELRMDLFYRIQVVHLELPPLRRRREDIPLLIDHFLRKFNLLFNKGVTGVEKEVMERLVAYHWPGNVRELENRIESAMNWVEGEILLREHFPAEIMGEDTEEKSRQEMGSGPYGAPLSAETLHLRNALQETEERFIGQAMRIAKGNVQKAAILLGIPRQTLQYKLKKWKGRIDR